MPSMIAKYYVEMLILLLSSTVAIAIGQSYVSVPTSYGVVQGRTVDYDVFLGIPYAQPPVGDLRFRAPRQANPYNTAGNRSASAAVMVFIDGSNGFGKGGWDESTQKGMVRNLVSRGVVVVTLQYRLGALGFFTTYTAEVQPNIGMLDQYLTTQKTTASWMIVRDDAFLPDSIENLAARRPRIPIIIGTVQDENADYAFKLISTGESNESQGEMFNNWMLDFARQNRLDPNTANQVSQIISQNYNVSPSGPLYDASTSAPQFNYNGNQMLNNGYQPNDAGYGNTYSNPAGCECQSSAGCVPCDQNPAVATNPYGGQVLVNNDQNSYGNLVGGYRNTAGINPPQNLGNTFPNNGYSNQYAGPNNQNNGYGNQNGGYNQPAGQGSNQYPVAGSANEFSPQYDQNARNTPQYDVQPVQTQSTYSPVTFPPGTAMNVKYQSNAPQSNTFQFTYQLKNVPGK
ncbi:Carboxylesterase [Teladorsagia circumcincta]|uniref:Carboxylesterase n=1 Tax=Teladorsagia circumcincta TaxID=45464 RepID=A0A2G9U7S6_TELCI|nr:Carboxylesterase [Teladorsagia circumcincta]